MTPIMVLIKRWNGVDYERVAIVVGWDLQRFMNDCRVISHGLQVRLIKKGGVLGFWTPHHLHTFTTPMSILAMLSKFLTALPLSPGTIAIITISAALTALLLTHYVRIYWLAYRLSTVMVTPLRTSCGQPHCILKPNNLVKPLCHSD